MSSDNKDKLKSSILSQLSNISRELDFLADPHIEQKFNMCSLDCCGSGLLMSYLESLLSKEGSGQSQVRMIVKDEGMQLLKELKRNLPNALSLDYMAGYSTQPEKK